MKAKQTGKVLLSLPPSVIETIDKAASRRIQSRSEYIRQSLLKALEADGLTPIAA